jgi:LysR family transcriptional regulator, low CO2-responsive transcriptional regulator
MPNPRIRRYTRHGTLLQLVALETTARLGSCSKAAEALHLSQPAISMMNKKLSEAVGLPLLQSNKKRLEATAAGDEMIRVAREMLDLLEGLEQRLAPLRGSPPNGQERVHLLGCEPIVH